MRETNARKKDKKPKKFPICGFFNSKIAKNTKLTKSVSRKSYTSSLKTSLKISKIECKCFNY